MIGHNKNVNRIYTADFIKRAILDKGVDEVRKIVYGESTQYEYIGMAKFINSRQRWCKRNILKNLKAEVKK